MTAIARLPLSAGTNFKPIIISNIASAGNLLHTATNVAGQIDEMWVWLTNISASDAVVTLEYGDATAPNHNVSVTVPANQVILALPGTCLNGGMTLKAFAAVASVIAAFGHINQITP